MNIPSEKPYEEEEVLGNGYYYCCWGCYCDSYVYAYGGIPNGEFIYPFIAEGYRFEIITGVVSCTFITYEAD